MSEQAYPDDWVFLDVAESNEHGNIVPVGTHLVIRSKNGSKPIGEIRQCALADLRPENWLWIKSRINVEELISRFQKLDYETFANGSEQDTLGSGNLVKLYNVYMYGRE